MKLKRGVAILLILVVAGGCSSVKVSQDFDGSKNFDGYRRYNWQAETQKKTGDVRIDNPFLDERIRTAIDRTLVERGFKKVEQGAQDFMVRYIYRIRSKIESSDARTGFGFGFGFGSAGRHGAIGISSGTNVNQYDEGILVIDFIESPSKALIWRGTGTRRVLQHTKPEKDTKKINELVEKLLAQYPPQT
jgi:hypothetical protein